MTTPMPTIHSRATTALARLAALTLLLLATALGAAGTATASETSTETSTESDSPTETDYARMVLVLDSSGSMSEPAGGGSTRARYSSTFACCASRPSGSTRFGSSAT